MTVLGNDIVEPFEALCSEAINLMLDVKIYFFSDLTFEKGDIIYLLKKVDKNWMNGECHGKTGVFPVNHVQVEIRTMLLFRCSQLYIVH